MGRQAALRLAGSKGFKLFKYRRKLQNLKLSLHSVKLWVKTKGQLAAERKIQLRMLEEIAKSLEDETRDFSPQL